MDLSLHAYLVPCTHHVPCSSCLMEQCLTAGASSFDAVFRPVLAILVPTRTRYDVLHRKWAYDFCMGRRGWLRHGQKALDLGIVFRESRSTCLTGRALRTKQAATCVFSCVTSDRHAWPGHLLHSRRGLVSRLAFVCFSVCFFHLSLPIS